jgi:hypothetical protein
MILLAIFGGIILLGVIVGAAVAIVAVCVAAKRSDDSGLGDEDVAAILGYPMWPAWQARQNASSNGADHEEPIG